MGLGLGLGGRARVRVRVRVNGAAVTSQPRASEKSVYHPKLPPTSTTRPPGLAQQAHVASCHACVSTWG